MVEPGSIIKLVEVVVWLEVGLGRVCLPQKGLKPSTPSFVVAF